MTGERVCITGISGFVGQHLASYLAAGGYEVSGVSRNSKYDSNIISWCDLWKSDLNYHTIIHAAGKAHDLKNTSDEKEYFTINTELTRRIYDAFLASDSAKVFIYMSSVKAVADTVSGELIEEHPPKPVGPYGKSKLAAENYIKNQNVPEGKFVYIIRPCMIYGPSAKGNLKLLYKMVSKGIPYPLAAFTNKRSFVSVENLCFVIEKLIRQKPISFGIYNISDDEAVSTTEIIKLMQITINKRVYTVRIPKMIIKGMARVGDICRLPLNTDRLQKLTENYVVSNQKIKRTLGIQLPVSTREGLQKTFITY